MVGNVTLQNLADTTDQVFPPPFSRESQLLNIYQYTAAYK